MFLKTRVLENNLEFKENISQLFTGEFSIKSTGNKGLDNVKSIFEIDYSAESCGVNGGGIYLFYNGNDLLKAIEKVRQTPDYLPYKIEDVNLFITDIVYGGVKNRDVLNDYSSFLISNLN